jgi:acyl-[acyl-carrier-protein]-phospholipid O-acyltransferase/long-chain-fatty-acid--[acyl-carrier-protein] ligase
MKNFKNLFSAKNMSFVLAAFVGLFICFLPAGVSVVNILLSYIALLLITLVVLIIVCPERVVRSIIYTYLNLFYNIEIKGKQNIIKTKGAAVILANNNSFIDPLILATYLPREVIFLTDSNIANRFWMKIILRYAHHLPVDPTNPMAIRTVLNELEKGKKIVIFPEGRMSTTGGIMKIYKGPSMIVQKANAPIIPIYIQNTQYSRFSYYGRKLRHRPHKAIIVNIMPARTWDLPKTDKTQERKYTFAEDKIYDLMNNMRLESFNTDQTIFEGLLEGASIARVKSRALEDMTRKTVTFRTLFISSFALGAKLAKLTKDSSYVGLMMPNLNATMFAFFGLSIYGRIPAMINFTSGKKNILSAIRATKIKEVITAKAFIEKAELAPIVEALEEEGIKIIYLEDVSKSISVFDKIGALIKGFMPRLAYNLINKDRNPDNPAVVLYTSGSEGTPKGVVLSHRNLMINKSQLCTALEIDFRDKFFNALPLFHSFGLAIGTIAPLLAGGSSFLYPSPLHFKIIPELVYDRNATVFFGTDTFFNAYCKNAHPYDFHNIRYAAVGAEKLKAETFNLCCEKMGKRLLDGYGATECSPLISVGSDIYYKRGSVGRLMPGMEYRLDPVEGIKEGGELVLRGGNIMLGYLRESNPGVIEAPKDGWYHTGDIVTVDERGFIEIKGRAKRFAKIAGEMVSLTAIEEALKNLWPTYMHAALRVPDPKRGEQLFVFTTKPNPSLDDIKQSFKTQGLSELWVPKNVKHLDEIILTGSGKFDYVKMEEMAKAEA